MTPRIIKNRARDETFNLLLRTMSPVYLMETLDLYSECIVQNGGSKEYAAECVMELLENYLDKKRE